MQVIDADEHRLIDLPGVGPCPRPVGIDQAVTGFRRLKSLRIYRFQPGPPIHGDSEVDEVLILPLAGSFQMQITGAHPLQALVSAQGPLRGLYMTPDHSYLLTPQSPVLVAYARAQAAGRVPVQAFATDESGEVAEHLRFHRVRLAAGEVLSQVGEALVHVVSGALDGVAAGQTMALAQGERSDLRAVDRADVLVISV
jgi:hypothetical protein